MQPVVQPFIQLLVRFDIRLYRVNGVLNWPLNGCLSVIMASCKVRGSECTAYINYQDSQQHLYFVVEVFIETSQLTAVLLVDSSVQMVHK